MKITIPESLKEIKLKDYQKYLRVVEQNEDKNIVDKTLHGKHTEEFLAIKMIEIFCHVTFNQARSMPVKDIEEIVAILNKTFESKRKFKRHFMIDDVEYGFIPSIEDISMGEYIDVNNYLGSNDDLHKLMAVLYRPTVIHKDDLYTIEEYEGSERYSGTMLNAPLDIVLEAQVFFYHLSNELLSSMKDYLAKAKPITQEKETTQVNGGGITRCMRWLGVST